MNELKPCPFCGGDAEKIQQLYRAIQNGLKAEYCYYVRCTKCKVKTYEYANERPAIKAWNNRQ